MHYRMLGPLEVHAETGPVDLGAPKQRAVLALLLLERGRVVSADRLIDAVWGDEAPPSVSASLQAYISNLRRLLRNGDGSPIERRQPGYLLDVPADAVDRTAFLTAATAARDAIDDADWHGAEAASREALALWRGPVLADLADESWVQLEANDLDERRMECREHRVTALLGLGRTVDAVAEAERLRLEAPLRERAAWLLMVALHRAGRAADALAAYRDHARRLDDELGLEPGSALRDLQAAILRQAEELSSWPAPPRAAAPAVREPSGRTASASTAIEAGTGFVGRSRELEAVSRALAADGAEVRWLVLTGPAGIGKTRLAEETVRALERRGSRVLRAGCPEDDGTPPWWPVRQLVRAAGFDPDVVLTPPPDAGADGARYVLYDRLDALLVGLGAPAVVLVDDVQWADATSLRWLTHVAESLQHAPLAFVLTVRDEVERADLARLLAAVARRPGARQLVVPPLDADEVGQLASLVSGEAVQGDEVALLAEQTGGNPFFVGEYARLPREERLAGGVPVAVRSVLRRRLGAVDPEVVQVLRTAAVAGDPFDIELVRSVLKMDRDDLADLLESAADEHLIVPDGLTYRFAHGLLRDEVLGGLTPPRRQRLHARVAEALRDGAGQDRIVRRAAHLTAALPLADPREVFAACRAAALDAEDRYQADTAATWWGSALNAFDLLPAAEQADGDRDDLLVAQVSALARAGRREAVLEVVESAVLEAVRAGRTASAGRLAAAMLRTSGVWPWTSATADASRLLTRLAGVEPLVRDDPAAHVRVLAALAVGSYYDPDPGVPDRLSARALAIAEEHGDPDVLADALWGRALAFSGLASRAAETVALVDRLAGLPHRLAGMDRVLCDTLLTLSKLTLGQPAAVEQHLRQAIAGSDAIRLPIARLQQRWTEGSLALWHGDLREAERLADLAHSLHVQTELYVMSVHDLATVALRWEQGRLEEADPFSNADAPTMPWLRAALLLHRGATEEGSALVRATVAHPAPEIWTTLGEQTLLANVVADQGLVELAPLLLALLAPHAGGIGTLGQVGVLGSVSLALARLSALVGETAEARRHLADAERLAAEGDGRCAAVRCRLLAARLDGAPPEAFEAVAQEAEALGMLGLAGRARAGHAAS